MKRLLIIAIACIAPIASAQLYKYVDKDGKTVYSDQPPVNLDSKQMNIPSASSANTPAGPAAAPKSALDRDRELQKTRDAARETAKKSDESAKQAQAREEACDQAKTSYLTYADGGRITKFEKGERVFLSDEEITVARERSKREMDEACKKS